MDGQILGTPAFMAPEQAGGQIEQLDERTDIYALGGVLYNILTLHAPVEAPNVNQLLIKVVKGDIPHPSTYNAESERGSKLKGQELAKARDLTLLRHCPGRRIPSALAAVAMKALALEPDDRYASLRDLQTDIEQFQGGFATVAEEAGPIRQSLLFLSRHRLPAAIVALAAALLISLLFGWIVTLRERTQEAVVARRKAEDAAAAEARQRGIAEDTGRQLEREAYFLRLMAAAQHIERRNLPAARALLAACHPSMRNIEWHRLNVLCHPELHAFPGAVSAGISTDGSRLVTGEHDGWVRTWDMASGAQLTAVQAGAEEIRAISFLRDTDARLAAAIEDDGNWYLHRIEAASDNAETIVRRQAPSRYSGQASFTFNGDGTLLAASTDQGVVELVDTVAAKTVQRYSGLGPEIPRCFFSRDGNWLYTSSAAPHSRAQVNVIDLSAPEQSQHLGANFGGGLTGFSPDGRQALIVKERSIERKTFCLYDFGKQATVREFRGHKHEVTCTDVSPDGRLVVSGGYDQTLKLWEIDTGRLLQTLPGHSNRVSFVRFLADGKRVLSGSRFARAVTIWQPDNLRTGWATPNVGWQIAISRDGRHLARGGSPNAPGSPVTITDTMTGETIRQFGHMYRRGIAYGADANQLAYQASDYSIRIVDAVSGAQRVSLVGHTAEVTRIVFDRTGGRLASASTDATIRLWDVNTGKTIRQWPGAVVNLTPVAFSPDDKWIAAPTAGLGKTVNVWETDSGALVHAFPHRGTINAVLFSPDGRTLAAGGYDSIMTVWDLASGQVLSTLEGHTGFIYGAAYNSDGSRLLTASRDGTVRLWETVTGRELTIVGSCSDLMMDVVVAPSDEFIAGVSVGEAGGQLSVWRCRQPEEIRDEQRTR